MEKEEIYSAETSKARNKEEKQKDETTREISNAGKQIKVYKKGDKTNAQKQREQ